MARGSTDTIPKEPLLAKPSHKDDEDENLQSAVKERSGRANPIAAFDSWISGSLHSWISKLPETRHFFLCLEHSGNGLLVIPLVVCFFINPWDSSAERRQFWLGMFFGLIFDLILVGLLKSLFRRPRPVYNRDMSVIISADHWSFPSGHASRAILLAALVTLRANVFPSSVSITFFSHELVFRTLTLVKVFDTWAVATAASRILLGRHYFLDVLCGCLLGYSEAEVTLNYLWPSLQVSESFHQQILGALATLRADLHLL